MIELNDLLNNNVFLQGVLSGITASIVLYFLGYVLKNIKKAIVNIRYFNVTSKTKILYAYDNFEKAEKQMYKDVENSKKIFVFASRDNYFSEPTQKMHKFLKRDDCDVRFLVLDPTSNAINERTIELRYPLSAIEQVKSSIAIIEGLQKKYSNIKLAKYNEMHRIRYYIFDEVMYLSFGLKSTISKDTQILRIDKESYLYKSLNEQFDDFWEKYYPLETKFNKTDNI